MNNLSFIIIIIIISSIAFSSSKSNEKLLNYLKDEQNWVLIDSRSDNIRVFEKNVPKMSLNALKVEKIVEIDTDKILKVVMDVNNYPDVLNNESMTSYIIGQKNGDIYAYNNFSIPLPFVSNRHYFFKINQVSKNEINWTLVNWEEVKSSYELKKILYVNHNI